MSLQEILERSYRVVQPVFARDASKFPSKLARRIARRNYKQLKRLMVSK